MALSCNGGEEAEDASADFIVHGTKIETKTVGKHKTNNTYKQWTRLWQTT